MMVVLYYQLEYQFETLNLSSRKIEEFAANSIITPTYNLLPRDHVNIIYLNDTTLFKKKRRKITNKHSHLY